MGSKRSRDSTRASTARSAVPSSEAVPHTPDTQSNAEASRVRPRSDIPLEVKDVIEHERRRLQQASAVLSCLKIAAMYQAWHEEVDAGDVAVIVQNLIDQTIERLDLIALARSAKELEALDATEGVPT